MGRPGQEDLGLQPAAEVVERPPLERPERPVVAEGRQLGVRRHADREVQPDGCYGDARDQCLHPPGRFERDDDRGPAPPPEPEPDRDEADGQEDARQGELRQPDRHSHDQQEHETGHHRRYAAEVRRPDSSGDVAHARDHAERKQERHPDRREDGVDRHEPACGPHGTLATA